MTCPAQLPGGMPAGLRRNAATRRVSLHSATRREHEPPKPSRSTATGASSLRSNIGPQARRYRIADATGSDASAEAHFHVVFAAISLQRHKGIGLQHAIEEDGLRAVPLTAGPQQVDAIIGFAVAVVQLVRFPVRRKTG